MAYVDSTTITNTTVEGLIIASNAYFPDADFRRVEVKTDGVVENSYVRSGGQLAIPNANGYVENIHVSNGGHIQIKGNKASGADLHVSQGGMVYVQNGASVTNLYISSGGSVQLQQGSVKNLTVETGATAIDVQGGVAVTTATINDKTTLNVLSGATVTGITQNGGTLNISSGATGENITYTDGTFVISSGATIRNFYKTAGTGVINLRTGAVLDGGAVYAGTVQALSNNLITNATIRSFAIRDGGAVIVRGKTNLADTISVSGGTLYIQSGASGVGIIQTGGTIDIKNFDEDGITAATLRGGTILGGSLKVSNGAVASEITIESSGTLSVFEGGFVGGVSILGSGSAVMNAAGTISGAVINDSLQPGGTTVLNMNNCNGLVNDVDVVWGNIYTLGSGSVTNLRQSAAQVIMRGSGAYVSGATVTGKIGGTGHQSGRLYFQNGASGTDITIGSGGLIYAYEFSGASSLHKSPTAANIDVIAGGSAVVSAGGTFTDIRISSGGQMTVGSGGHADSATVMIGGSLLLDAGALTEGTLALNLTGATGNTVALIDDLTRVTAGTTVAVKLSEWGSENSYVLATTGNAGLSIGVTNGSVSATLADGDSIVNPFAGVAYTWNGTSLIGGGHITTVVDTAAALSVATADSINDDDLSGKWGSATAVASGNVYLAANMTEGTAWLELDGYNGGAGTTLYGAQGSTFADGTVNILAKSGSLRNLAAGANAGGTVKAVNLTFAGAELDGTGYAGGFGNVTGKTATTITTGTFAKDFYAGALANKLTTTTSVGDVAITVAGGTFDGNIYGASAVKTDSTKGNGTRHMAGNVTLTVTGGSTTKGNQACIFAGGYATGNATGTVYKVDSVTATISGGDWGTACGGRGVFGGVMASGVEAQVLGAVNITISGDATMGNVYGGGWAQKTGAKSIVGNVNINIAGGTVTNVFGGGSHSTTGGTTETGDVTITVSGGDITGSIYARGQLDGDITGAANVIFTGSDGFDCDVFGYSYVGGAGEGAALSFSGYTGEFAGAIGGFDGITFDGATAMTLDTAANDISNGAWEFDFTERDASLSGSSLLTWSGADFTNDTIKVTFADDAQAQGGWNIATVAEAFSGTTFNVEIDGTEIAGGLAYGGQIASGDYAGWGFELESGVLKFKNLASA